MVRDRAGARIRLRGRGQSRPGAGAGQPLPFHACRRRHPTWRARADGGAWAH